MIRVNILCEGQTEETFVNEVLYYHLQRMQVFVKPIIFRTSKGPAGRGGVTSYARIKHQVNKLNRSDTSAFVTTMLDLYGLPNDFAGYSSIPSACTGQVIAAHLENAFAQDIDNRNFIPNILVHEFEGLLYSRPEAFETWFDSSVVDILTEERNEFETPEDINNSRETAPSKRLLKHCFSYEKVIHGSAIALDIGLDVIRQECKHFNSWLEKLEQLQEIEV